MKAIGASTAIGLVGGLVSADEHLDDEMEEKTVHEVSTQIRESTNPERPADFFYQPTGLHVEEGDVVRFTFDTPDHNITSYHPAFGMQRRIPLGAEAFSSPIMGWDPNSLADDATMPPGPEGGMMDEEGTEDETDEDDVGDEEETEDEETDEDGFGDDEDDGIGDDTDDGVGTGNESEDDEDDDVAAQEEPTPTTWLYSFDEPGVYDIECAPHEGFGMAMRVVVGDETETEFETSDAEALPEPRVGPVGMAREVLTDPNLEPETIVEEGRVDWMDLEVNGGEMDDEEEDDTEGEEDEEDDEFGDDETDDEIGDDETGDDETEDDEFGDDETDDETEDDGTDDDGFGDDETDDETEDDDDDEPTGTLFE